MAALISAIICGAQPAAAQFVQQGAKLVGTGAVNSGSPAEQGYSVALSGNGNTVIIGGPFDDSSVGAAWVFTRGAGGWTQQDKLIGTGAGSDAREGYSVAVSADGNTAIVGARSADAVWVFIRSNGTWSQEAKLTASGEIGNAELGISVALSADGNTAIAGGTFDNSGAGAAWVFTRSDGGWTQQDKLIGAGAVTSQFSPANQGTSVALSADGSTAIVGGDGDDGHAGAAWVFTRRNGVWSQQGDKLVGSGATGGFQGISVALSDDGNTAIVGGYGDNEAAWVFTRSGNVWSQQGDKLVGAGAVARPWQGYSVALSADGNTAIVGGPHDNGDPNNSILGVVGVGVHPQWRRLDSAG